MSIADILITITTWIFQSAILPLMPENLPLISLMDFNEFLNEGTMIHNLASAFSGINQFLNIKLLLILLSSILFAEIILWLVRVGFFLIKTIRG